MVEVRGNSIAQLKILKTLQKPKPLTGETSYYSVTRKPTATVQAWPLFTGVHQSSYSQIFYKSLVLLSKLLDPCLHINTNWQEEEPLSKQPSKSPPFILLDI